MPKIALSSKFPCARPSTYAAPVTERKWPAEMLVAIVDIAMDGHRSERELRKYSSGPTLALARARRPIVNMMTK